MGLGGFSQKIYLAGALHDIGKVAIGNDILEKPDKLTDEEYSVMKHHMAYTTIYYQTLTALMKYVTGRLFIMKDLMVLVILLVKQQN